MQSRWDSSDFWWSALLSSSRLSTEKASTLTSLFQVFFHAVAALVSLLQVYTGFRLHPRGAQGAYDVKACHPLQRAEEMCVVRCFHKPPGRYCLLRQDTGWWTAHRPEPLRVWFQRLDRNNSGIMALVISCNFSWFKEWCAGQQIWWLEEMPKRQLGSTTPDAKNAGDRTACPLTTLKSFAMFYYGILFCTMFYTLSHFFTLSLHQIYFPLNLCVGHRPADVWVCFLQMMFGVINLWIFSCELWTRSSVPSLAIHLSWRAWTHSWSGRLIVNIDLEHQSKEI